MVYVPSEHSSSTYGKGMENALSNTTTAGLSTETKINIPFNHNLTTNQELEYIREALLSGRTSGDGSFTKKCKAWLEQQTGCASALITHSCTAALEMAAILANIQPGDEVIMPSYTFVSTANAFVLRGGVPVFVDIRPDTLNIDETCIEAAITSRTKAIAPVHYAGVSCEMNAIMAIAQEHDLLVIEDAAQAISAQYHGKPVGTMGHMSALSFHETKNIMSGEGGALLINDRTLLERAEIIREKGTNRSKFFRGELDKYTWVDVGSSYLPSDLIAAFLLAQLEQSEYLLKRRGDIWNYYHETFAVLEAQGLVRRPQIPAHCQHNGHIYYLIVQDLETRTALMAHLKAKGIQSTFHYVPLHSAPAGLKYGRAVGSMEHTDRLSDCLIRLPLGSAMSMQEATQVSTAVLEFLLP
ncbi:MAG: dTDP-4-amino-4,6-dideoxygalactose transaminase [Oculatellaceae cyanobacterium Prado106]|jgi:dTDP-4-amino-4,6-dideoxygalactose transaminase|nr:dTDP-4-amino-4,6-dideoxygalactose transaminase [Oculatellaceae cyanobacterium Prado106]